MLLGRCQLKTKVKKGNENMNTLLNINPWSIFDDLLNVNSRAFKSIRSRAAGRFPPINMFMDESAVIIDVELPGKSASDIKLELEPQAVTIEDSPTVKEGEEKREGEWRRRIELPFRVEAEKANAKFQDGILRI